MDTLTVKFVLDGRIHKRTVVPPNFERLVEIAGGICGFGLPNFYLSYEDSEGDSIIMTDNENLTDATSVAKSKDKMLKVNINPTGEP